MHRCVCAAGQQATAQTAQRDPSNAQKLHSGSLSGEQCTHHMQHHSTAVLAPTACESVNTPLTMQTHEPRIAFFSSTLHITEFQVHEYKSRQMQAQKKLWHKAGHVKNTKHFQVSCQQTLTTDCIAASRPADCLALLMLQPMAEAPTMTAHSQPAN